MYFPEKRDFMALEKQFVADLIYSVKRDAFAAWVDERVEQRNKRLATEKDSQIVMHKKAADAFLNSTFVSKQRGTSHNLLKIGNKRRKTKAMKDEEDRVAAEEE